MAEALVERLDRLEFEVLCPGDNVAITTGLDSDAWKYDIGITDVARWPTGNLHAYNPEGEILEPVQFELRGCAQWTNKSQNPVQRQERGFTPYYDGLIVGDFLWGRFTGESDIAVFDKPGQEISAIERTPYQENAVLRALTAQAAALSVRQIVEAAVDCPIVLAERDIRLTLARLVSAGLVSRHKKKVLQYSLTEAT